MGPVMWIVCSIGLPGVHAPRHAVVAHGPAQPPSLCSRVVREKSVHHRRMSCATLSLVRITTAGNLGSEAGVVPALALTDKCTKWVTKTMRAEAWPASTGLLDSAFKATSRTLLV